MDSESSGLVVDRALSGGGKMKQCPNRVCGVLVKRGGSSLTARGSLKIINFNLNIMFERFLSEINYLIGFDKTKSQIIDTWIGEGVTEIMVFCRFRAGKCGRCVCCWIFVVSLICAGMTRAVCQTLAL